MAKLTKINAYERLRLAAFTMLYEGRTGSVILSTGDQ